MRTLDEIGEAIRAARIGRGWTQRELAEKVGISDKTISKVEVGRSCELENLLGILSVLGLDLHFGEAQADPREVPEVVTALKDVSREHHALVARFLRLVPLMDDEHRDILLMEMGFWERKYLQGKAERQ